MPNAGVGRLTSDLRNLELDILFERNHIKGMQYGNKRCEWAASHLSINKTMSHSMQE